MILERHAIPVREAANATLDCSPKEEDCEPTWDLNATMVDDWARKDSFDIREVNNPFN